MRNRVLVLLVVLLSDIGSIQRVIAQIPQKEIFGHYFRFSLTSFSKENVTNSPETYLASDTAVNYVLEYLLKKDRSGSISTPKSKAILGVSLNPNLSDFNAGEIKSVSKLYASYSISDSSTAKLIALGITKKNYQNYRYHVVENDSIELVPWTKIPRMEQKYGAKQLYGFIGDFCFPGRQVIVEVVNVMDYSDRDGIAVNWISGYRPGVAEINISNFNQSYLNLLQPKTNHGWATHFNPLNGMPLQTIIPVDSVVNMRVVFKKHVGIPYSLFMVTYNAAKADTNLIMGGVVEQFYDLSNQFFNKVGRYELIIQRTASPFGYRPFKGDQILSIPFEIKPPPPLPDKKVSLKQALPYIIATLTGVVLLFGAYYRRNQVKLLRAAQAKQTAGLKLRSIRAQLNPHFMFNALTSIQNLVNKNDISAANHYLSKFAGLTRQVLDTGNEELLSLEQEINILDDYLQMEQLRFGFKYHIDIDKGLNKANIEIPAMLLQPFVENAVKHGVAILKDAGRIEIVINRVDNDIIFCIKDNGKWIDANGTAGYGLKLSEERVVLLNQLYKDQPVRLTIDKQPATVVCIRLTNWI